MDAPAAAPPPPAPASHAEVVRLAVPNVLSNLTVPLLGFVDTAVCGRMEGLGPLGAVALGATAFQFLYWGFGFLRMGTTGLVAQALGEGRPEEGERALARALAVAAVAGVALVALQGPLGRVAFALLAAPPEVLPDVRTYFHVRVWAAPASLGLFALQGWFLGMQDARWPLLVAVASNLANALLDWLLAVRLGWGVAGVAWGTLLSQYLGLAVAWAGFRAKTGRAWPRCEAAALTDAAALGRLAALSGDIAVRTLSMLAVLAVFMARSAEAGPLVLAVNSILMNVWSLHAYLVDGVAFAGESLVGRAYGAAQRAAAEPGAPPGAADQAVVALRATVARLMAWGVAASLPVAAGFWLARRPLLEAYTDKPAVLAGALAVFGWTVAAPVVNAVAFVWDGVYLGATASRALRDAMLGCGLLVFLPALALAEGRWGPHGLWLALTAWEAARGLSLTWMAEGALYRPLAGRG